MADNEELLKTLTRAIHDLEYRTPLEVFDMMSDRIRRTLASRSQSQGVAVKALEWREFKALGGRTKLCANDCFGNEFARLDLAGRTNAEIEEFKIGAQKSYDADIHSALASTAPKGVGDKLEKLRRWRDGWLASHRANHNGRDPDCTSIEGALAYGRIQGVNVSLAALSPVPAEAPADAGWCQPMDQGKHKKRQFLVWFEDAEKGISVFDDEAEARAFWERANVNWNCYLFGALPLAASPLSAGERKP